MQRFKKRKKGEKNKSIIERAAIIVEVWSKEVSIKRLCNNGRWLRKCFCQEGSVGCHIITRGVEEN